MAETRSSFGNLRSHLILEVLISAHLSANDLVSIELTSKVFGLKNQYSSEFKSVADHAASRLCSLHPIFVGLSSSHQNELFKRCKRNWKRVLRFLQSILDSWDITKPSRGNMQITTVYNYTMVINNSKVYSCGSNGFGALAQGPETIRGLRLIPIDLPCSAQVIQVSASEHNAAFVMKSGEVFTCGRNGLFSCGHSDIDHPIYWPKLVEVLNQTPCKQVASGNYPTVFLSREGDVYTVGGNKYGQLGHGDTIKRQMLKMVELSEKIVQISAGPYYVLAVTKEGSVYSFGDGSNLCLGHGSFENKLQPHAIQAFKTKGVHILRVCAGDEHAMAIDSNGYVYTWGRGALGALGHGDQNNKSTPEILLSLKNHLAVQVCARKMKSFVLAESGLVYGFGWSGYGSLGLQDSRVNEIVDQPRVLECLRPHRVVQVTTGRFHTMVSTQEGRLLGFGDNRESQLGHHSIQSWLKPTEIFLHY